MRNGLTRFWNLRNDILEQQKNRDDEEAHLNTLIDCLETEHAAVHTSKQRVFSRSHHPVNISSSITRATKHRLPSHIEANALSTPSLTLSTDIPEYGHLLSGTETSRVAAAVNSLLWSSEDDFVVKLVGVVGGHLDQFNECQERNPCPMHKLRYYGLKRFVHQLVVASLSQVT